MKLPAFVQRLSPRKRILFLAAPASVLVLVVILIASSGSSDVEMLPTTPVVRAPLRINLVESGTIRPRQQITIRNDTSRTVNIVQIAPEGTLVKKGDLLVKFDETEMANNLVERRIRVQNSESSLVAATEDLKTARIQAQQDLERAKLDHDFAKLDLNKFLNGDRPQQLKSIKGKITLAQEDLTLAKEKLRWSQILFDEKYLSQSDLQRDELAAKKATLAVELAEQELAVYENYTSKRQFADLESRVQQTKLALERTRSRTTGSIALYEARHRAAEASHREELARLKRDEAESELYAIYAPISGMVLYASSVDSRWRGDPVEVGLDVRPATDIIYLPTAEEYDVDILVSEVNLNKLATGLDAKIKLDALPHVPLAGKLASIAPLPDAGSRWLNPNLKLYKTTITVDPSQASLRNGMSCQVEILVEDIADTLQLPLQAVVRENNQSVVYVLNGRKPEPRSVRIGRDNNRMIQILDGLAEGESVLLTPPLGRDPAPARLAGPPPTGPAETKAAASDGKSGKPAKPAKQEDKADAKLKPVKAAKAEKPDAP